MDLIPDDLVAEILRRLPARGVAACRTVCKRWRAAVDDRQMLLVAARRAPRPMRGFFLNYSRSWGRLSYFARGQTASPSVAADDSALGFMPRPLFDFTGGPAVLDHRNGLLLYTQSFVMYVYNPATRRGAKLPPPLFGWAVAYLIFDPVESLHYHVLLFRKIRWDDVGTGEPMEWPPREYMVQVFSSATNQWEERPFLREGEATMVTMWADRYGDPQRNAVYWRGSLYLHCRSGLVIRFSLDKGTYLAIKAPEIDMTPDPGEQYNMDIEQPRVYLAKSQKGIYFTMIYQCQLYAWVLLEASESTPKWVLNHRSHLMPSIRSCILDHGKAGVRDDGGDCEWEFADYLSDEDLNKQKEGKQSGCEPNCVSCRHITLLGYHPYKEIAFLGTGHSKGFVYYTGTFEQWYLGSLHPMGYPYVGPVIQESFIYTPCEEDLLPTLDESIVTPA